MDSLFHRPGDPLPGTRRAPAALFIGRWGTLLRRPETYPVRIEEAHFHPGALDALFQAHQAGWKLYLIGNEDDVAMGRVTDEHFEGFENSLLEHVRSLGIPVVRSYACLDHPEGKGAHEKDSVFLLPNTGAMYHAAQSDGIDLRRSWLVGDSSVELVSGWRAGCRIAGVKTGHGMADGTFEVDAEFVAADLGQALTELLSAARV